MKGRSAHQKCVFRRDVKFVVSVLLSPSAFALTQPSTRSPHRFGVRFPCMSDAYNRELQQLAMDVGQELGYGDFLKEGVYCVLGGPSFETIAECRMLHKLGADAVGE